MKKILLTLLLIFPFRAFAQETPRIEQFLMFNLYERMILYQNCQNLIWTNVPAMGPSYRPIYTFDKGKISKGQISGDINIYPSELGECTLSISAGKTFRSNVKFMVLPTPAPTVFLGDSTSKEISMAEPIKKGEYRIIPRPEANFLNTLPKECNYKVSALTCRY